MAEVLHYSRSGVQGPMMNAPPAKHTTVTPHQPPFTPAWLPSGPDPGAPFTVDAGLRHKQTEAFVGASAAAAEALGDELIGREPRRTPSGPAAPYQKAAAQRSAERALRPWDPISGAGERAGAVLLKVAGANAGAAALAPANAPSLFFPPSPLQAEAVAVAAGRVARGGQGQAGADGAFSVRPGAPSRELWAVEVLTQPPKYCTACRGGHEPSKVGNPEWMPYTPAARLGNLQLLDTKFRRAQLKGLLCCRLSGLPGDPIRWAVQPGAMPPEQFRQQLALAMDGIREGHEPFRFLATRAVEALLAAPGRGDDVGTAVPELVAPLKLCLNTMQPQLVGGGLLLIIRLLRSHPSVATALAPYLRHLLPTLAVFRSHTRPLELPAPVCLPPTGSFSGSAAPHGSVRRTCRVCGAPVFRTYDEAAARAAAAAEPLVWGSPEAAAAAAAGGPAEAAAKPLPGRTCRRYTLESLVEEVLGLVAGGGGEVARRMVRSYIPGFTYFPPEDQPSYSTVEEVLESRAAAAAPGRRRPGSAPRAGARRRPSAAGGGAAAAKSSMGAARRRQPQPRQRSDGGGGGVGGAARPWSSSVLSASELARWDGIEIRDLPYGEEIQLQARDHVSIDGGGGGGGTAALRISTPVPVFDSPHDPLYRVLLAARFDGDPRVSGGGNAVLSHDGPAAAAAAGVAAGRRAGGVRRGGSGGAAPRVNVNAEVPYKASSAGLRQAW